MLRHGQKQTAKEWIKLSLKYEDRILTIILTQLLPTVNIIKAFISALEMTLHINLMADKSENMKDYDS